MRIEDPPYPSDGNSRGAAWPLDLKDRVAALDGPLRSYDEYWSDMVSTACGENVETE